MSYHTYAACSASWAAEPRLRRLIVEFGGGLEITYVMGGLARQFENPPELVMGWLEHAAEQGRVLAEGYLRRLREGFMCHRRKLDGPEALVEEARRAGLDAERFRIDLESHAILEAFGADLELAGTIPPPRSWRSATCPAPGRGRALGAMTPP